MLSVSIVIHALPRDYSSYVERPAIQNGTGCARDVPIGIFVGLSAGHGTMYPMPCTVLWCLLRSETLHCIAVQCRLETHSGNNGISTYKWVQYNKMEATNSVRSNSNSSMAMATIAAQRSFKWPSSNAQPNCKTVSIILWDDTTHDRNRNYSEGYVYLLNLSFRSRFAKSVLRSISHKTTPFPSPQLCCLLFPGTCSPYCTVDKKRKHDWGKNTSLGGWNVNPINCGVVQHVVLLKVYLIVG